MSLQDINNAAAAQNALSARINAFMDDADAEIEVRRDAYDALAADLVGIVSDSMEMIIDYEPNEAEADLVAGGHFTTWGELITFANAAPPHSQIIVRLPDNTVITNDARFLEHIYGPRHWVFKAKEPSALGPHTPVFEIGLYDQVNYNQYNPLTLGNSGSFSAEYVKFRWAVPINPALPFSVNTPFLPLGASNFIDLRLCEITNADGLALISCTTGSIGKVALHSVTLDGDVLCLGRSGTSNVALLTAGAVTLLNGASIYSSAFTPGTDLITN